MIRSPYLCPGCSRFDGKDTCDAFPDGIPVRILQGASHFDPVEGEGLVFDPQEGSGEMLVTYLSFWYQASTEDQ